MINQLALLQGGDSADGTWRGDWDETVRPRSNSKEPNAECTAEDTTFEELGVDEISKIRASIGDIQSYSTKIKNLESKYVNAVNQKDMSGTMREVDNLVQESVQIGQKVRLQLETLKKKNAEFEKNQSVNSTKVAWRNNQFRSLMRALKEATKSVQSATDNFRTSVSRRHVRSYCIIAEVDESEKAMIVQRAEEDPYGMQEEIMAKIGAFGVSDSTLDKIESLEKQNRDMRLIEEAVKNLNQMFEQMATMVDSQGDIIDEISHSVEQTRDYITLGKVSIEEAAVYASSARKKKVCILILCIVIVIILIVVPISV